MYRNDQCLSLDKHLENVNSFLLFALSLFVYSDFFIYLSLALLINGLPCVKNHATGQKCV